MFFQHKVIKNFISQEITTLVFKSFLLISFVSRLFIAVYSIFYEEISINNNLELLSAFATGLVKDIFTVIYFLSILIPIRFVISKALPFKARVRLYFLCYFIFYIFLIATAIAEIAFWDEFGTRFNFIAVDYLIYTNEIIGTIKESMPFKEISAGILFLSFCATYFLRHRIISNAQIIHYYGSYASLILFPIMLLLFHFFSPNILYFSNNRYINELSNNGLYEFFSAYRSNYLKYEELYPNIDKKLALSTVRNLVLQKNQKFLNEEDITRVTTNNSTNNSNANVIFIVVESLSAHFMGKFGNQDGITPNLDALANESLLFTNFYASGTRTVRGLEAVTLSTPPTPGSSIIRRENISDLFNLSTVFRASGYKTSFVFGGYSYFDNLYNFFSQNKYEILDRNELTSKEISFSNVWGVADEDIFNKSFEIFDKEHKEGNKFFSLIMTTSNHRPYNFPDNRIDLPSSGGGRNAAVKYTDYAIGQFIKKAKTKPWFNNTIFVITADHCASSAGKKDLPIDKYHIPLLIYAPQIINNGLNNSLSSQIDIAPTIFAILGLNYSSKFFGRDIINDPAERAFVGTYQLLGYYKNNHLIILSPAKKPEIFKIFNNERLPLTEKEKLDKNQLIIEAISMYQTAYTLYTEGKMKE